MRIPLDRKISRVATYAVAEPNEDFDAFVERMRELYGDQIIAVEPEERRVKLSEEHH